MQTVHWSQSDVCRWATEKGFGRYQQNFIDAGIDGRKLLMLGPNDVRTLLCVANLADRKKLCAEIEKLKAAPGVRQPGQFGPAQQQQEAATHGSPSHGSPTFYRHEKGSSPATFTRVRPKPDTSPSYQQSRTGYSATAPSAGHQHGTPPREGELPPPGHTQGYGGSPSAAIAARLGTGTGIDIPIRTQEGPTPQQGGWKYNQDQNGSYENEGREGGYYGKLPERDRGSPNPHHHHNHHHPHHGHHSEHHHGHHPEHHHHHHHSGDPQQYPEFGAPQPPLVPQPNQGQGVRFNIPIGTQGQDRGDNSGGNSGEDKQRLQRGYSIRSFQTLNTLQGLSEQLAAYEHRRSQLTAHPRHRDEICAIYGEVDKMLATRIDGIVTSELDTGKDEARLERKVLVKRAEKLLDTLSNLKQAIPSNEDHSPQQQFSQTYPPTRDAQQQQQPNKADHEGYGDNNSRFTTGYTHEYNPHKAPTSPNQTYPMSNASSGMGRGATQAQQQQQQQQPQQSQQQQPHQAHEQYVPAPAPDKTVSFVESPDQQQQEERVGKQQRLQRGYSMRSYQTLNTLQGLSDALASIEARCAEVTQAPPDHKYNDEISQLYGEVDKMLATQIDSITTSELDTGKDEARLERKVLVKRAQKLLDTLMNLKQKIASQEGQPNDDTTELTPTTIQSAETIDSHQPRVSFDMDEEEASEHESTPGAKPLSRAYSMRSKDTLSTLAQLKEELVGLEEQSSVVTERSAIAQMYGVVDKMLSTRIDGVVTAELASGKDEARAERKELVKRAERLLDRLQNMIDIIEKREVK